jgi:trigger factor
MKTTSKQLSNTRVEITVNLNAEDLAATREAAVERLAGSVKVSGFRKGKVPKDVAEKHIDGNALASEMLNIAVNRAVPTAFKEAGVRPLMVPQVNVTKYVPGEIVEMTATADIYPEVKLGKYKGLKAKRVKVEIKEADVEDTIKRIAESFAEPKVVQRKAKMGDEVIVDFVGKKGGEAFKGGSAKGFKLRLGSGQFIPGFEDGIVGQGSGDKIVLPLTFPKEYHMADLAGAKVEFEVLVKQVSEVSVPKIDDELAKKCGPFKDLASLKKDILKNLTEQGEHRAEEQYKDNLVNELVAESKVEAPEVLIDDQMRLIRKDLDQNLETHKVSFEQYLEQAKKTEAEWTAEARKAAEARVKAALVLQELAKEMKVAVDEEAVAAKVTELREVYKKNEDAVKQLARPEVVADIQNRLTIEKTVNELVELNK